jgi:methylated-DNA-[protein]-cysteine S-methyltransferase
LAFAEAGIMEKQLDVYKDTLKSPIGNLEIKATDKGIREIVFAEGPLTGGSELNEHIELCKSELDKYFDGSLKNFTVPLDITGTEFQKLVWMTLRTISYGETVSYLDVAEMIGDRNSLRAVGLVNNNNSIPVIIPCHRVVGSDGKLVGYAGGLWRKHWLLNHEKTFSNAEMQLEIF